MTKRWSSVRSDLTATKRQASKLERQEAKTELAEFIEQHCKPGMVVPFFKVRLESKPDNVHSNEH
jgi:hypothetical protein